jgi:hypothetical protein
MRATENGEHGISSSDLWQARHSFHLRPNKGNKECKAQQALPSIVRVYGNGERRYRSRRMQRMEMLSLS